MAKDQDKIAKNRLVLAIGALIALAVSYGFASLAIDRGSLWAYAATAVFLITSIRLAIHAFRNQR